jgi:aminoglycoside 6'-N-acetyltransferase
MPFEDCVAACGVNRLQFGGILTVQSLQVHISFRPLALADFPQLLAWLNEPLVNEWYCSNKKRSIEDVYETYAPRVHGSDPTECFIVSFNRVDAGLIQCYWVTDYPDYGKSIGAEPGWMGVDYFIGVPALRGRGFGSLFLRTFVEDRVFRQYKARSCVSSPDPRNIRSIRALERAGFRHLRTVTVQEELEYVMIRNNKEIADFQPV